MSAPVRATLEEDGTLLSLVVDRPPGNVLDGEVLDALRDEVRRAASRPAVRTLLFSGEGRHFSFGASVEEHQPHLVGDMLPRFHGLFRDLLDCRKVLLAAVRGQCLGGGLELAAFCHQVFAAPDARLGQPEVKLAVIAPVASLILPLRAGQGVADDLLLTGRAVPADVARRLRLVDHLADDPVLAARAWHQEYLRPLSPAALRYVSRASRQRYERAIREDLPELERLYLEELMSTADAREGIAAFLEKRSPRWTDQ